MCLAVPLELIEISSDGRAGIVSTGGSKMEVGLDLVPEAKPGDYLLIHAGIAIQVLEKEEAEETLRIFRQYSEQLDRLVPEADISDD